MQQEIQFNQNAIYVPHLDEYIVSTHRHHCVSYDHVDGRYVFIDGGSDYFRGGGHLDLYREGIVQEFHIGKRTPFEVIVTRALWGTRGKDGKQSVRYRPIKEFKRAHLRAIKKNCSGYMHPVLLDVVKYWLEVKYNE